MLVILLCYCTPPTSAAAILRRHGQNKAETKSSTILERIRAASWGKPGHQSMNSSSTVSPDRRSSSTAEKPLARALQRVSGTAPMIPKRYGSFVHQVMNGSVSSWHERGCSWGSLCCRRCRVHVCAAGQQWGCLARNARSQREN